MCEVSVSVSSTAVQVDELLAEPNNQFKWWWRADSRGSVNMS